MRAIPRSVRRCRPCSCDMTVTSSVATVEVRSPTEEGGGSCVATARSGGGARGSGRKDSCCRLRTTASWLFSSSTRWKYAEISLRYFSASPSKPLVLPWLAIGGLERRPCPQKSVSRTLTSINAPVKCHRLPRCRNSIDSKHHTISTRAIRELLFVNPVVRHPRLARAHNKRHNIFHNTKLSLF